MTHEKQATSSIPSELRPLIEKIDAIETAVRHLIELHAGNDLANTDAHELLREISAVNLTQLLTDQTEKPD